MPKSRNLLSTSKRLSSSRPRLNLECLEDRLTPSWGSVPPAVVPPPANATPVILNSQGDAVGNADISSTEVDWYKFTAHVTGMHVFQATTPASNLDTVAGLYSSTGMRLAFNDDMAAGNNDSSFSASLTSGKVYYLGVTNYNGTPPGSYSWSINGPAGDPPPPPDDVYEQNDGFATPTELGTLSATKAMQGLVMADGHDWYRFTLTTAGTTSSIVAVTFQNAQGNVDLELYNAAGVPLGASNSANDGETLSLNGVAPGTYYVHVTGAANPNYSLTITPPGGGVAPPTGSYDITLLTNGLTATQQAIFEQAAQKWESIITAGLAPATYNGMTTTGVIINASGIAIDGPGGILGQAGPDRFRSGSSLPYHGVMQFDSADMATLQNNGGLIHTVMHEMAHVLGLGTIWSTKGLISGAGTSNPVFLGAKARAAYEQIFRVNATGVPVENSGGPGTRDAHWRESVFGNEIMTGYLNSGANPISRVTVASMADLGYTVDMSKADPYTRPGGGGVGGGSGSGGGAALRAPLTGDVSDLARRLASGQVSHTDNQLITPTCCCAGCVTAAVFNPADKKQVPAVQSSVSSLAQQTLNRSRLTDVAGQTSNKPADALFSRFGLNTNVTKPLLA
jgi:hypothetical protein